MIRNDVVYCDECGGSIADDDGSWLGGRVVCHSCRRLLLKAAGVPPAPPKPFRPVRVQGQHGCATIVLILSVFGSLLLVGVAADAADDGSLAAAVGIVIFILCIIVALLAVVVATVSAYFGQTHLKDKDE